jgi:N-acetylglucosaminyldiphosphoundecaprenol N-acetyl-beta-D-mannosaminyltransferase
MTEPQTNSKAEVLGTSIDALNMESAIAAIAKLLIQRRKGYVCLANVYGITEARRDPRLASIYRHAVLTLPDGAPAAWVGRLQGHKEMRRVAGPELMLEVFGRKEFAGVKHFFYGGAETVAQELQKRLTGRFPGSCVVGTYTPPFRELNRAEEDALIKQVRKLKPDIIWVGVGSPKQDYFMQRYLMALDVTLMFGVGAAFDIHTGRVHDAPRWIKSMGMQWLHRLVQDPRRLWKRYLFSNTSFLGHITLQITKLRRYAGTEGQQDLPAEEIPARFGVR